MATATTLVSRTEYLTTSYEHDPDWVDGELRERGVPDLFQGLMQTFFLQFFAPFEDPLGVVVVSEVRLRVSPTRFRIPNVMLLPDNTPLERWPETIPALCIEVLSPDDSMGEMQEKIADYLAMGVGTVWIVEPRKRVLSMASESGLRQVSELTLPGTEMRVGPAEIFARLDRMR